MLPPPDERRRRVKAARALAGYASTDDLADAIKEAGEFGRGYSGGTLRNREGAAGEDFNKKDLMVIAAACALPYEFFEVDFAQLPLLVRRVEGDRLPPPRGGLRRELEDDRPSPQDRPEDQSDEDTGSAGDMRSGTSRSLGSRARRTGPAARRCGRARSSGPASAAPRARRPTASGTSRPFGSVMRSPVTTRAGSAAAARR